MSIDLQQFCAEAGDLRPYLEAPFSKGEFTYATDGRVMVRLPRLPDIETPEGLPEKTDWNKPLAGMDEATFAPISVSSLPDASVFGSDEECEACDGTGHEHADCPDCDCTCDNCGGDGKRRLRISTALHGVNFDLRFIMKVLTLPDVQFSTTAKEGYPLLFKFAGGVGAVMPLRRQYEKHIDIVGGML